LRVAHALLLFRHYEHYKHHSARTTARPDEWKTGDEPMTAAQRSYLETLCNDTGETFDENLSKPEASKMIDELRQRSPRLAEE
jgi:hypothetical protein